MRDSSSDFWLVARLARQSIDSGTLRGYWPGLALHRSNRSALTVWTARVVYMALVPIVPLVAARHRRLVARALEAVVRAVVGGVAVTTAVERAVTWLVRKGVEPTRAREDLERLLAGFLSSPRQATPETSEARRTSSDFTSAG